MPLDIKSQSAEEIERQFKDWGQPAYRVRQVLEWLYTRRATDWETMSNLPKSLRQQLRAHYSLGALELVRKQGAADTTRKFLWRLKDHALIESVLIPANPALYGEPSDRHTLCVSTQVGCAFGCKFCASGLDGWKRNLEPDEIVEQVLAVEREENPKTESRSPKEIRNPKSKEPKDTLEIADRTPDRPGSPDDVSRFTFHVSRFPAASRLVTNLVIMGMGEPLANYDNLLKALRILNAPWGGGIGARKMTVSTSGLVPQIRRLADESMQLRLAISLHGATDSTRAKIMPINRKYPLKDLTAACEYYHQKKGRMITFEYILIAGVNDGLDQAQPLAVLARRFNAKVNLIPYNRVEGLPWQRPDEPQQEAFLAALQRQKVSATLRREKGGDIDAACGQLRLKTERELGGTS